MMVIIIDESKITLNLFRSCSTISSVCAILLKLSLSVLQHKTFLLELFLGFKSYLYGMQMLSYAWVTDVCIQLYLNCNLLRCLVTLVWRCSVILGMDVLKLENAKGFGGMLNLPSPFQHLNYSFHGRLIYWVPLDGLKSHNGKFLLNFSINLLLNVDPFWEVNLVCIVLTSYHFK